MPQSQILDRRSGSYSSTATPIKEFGGSEEVGAL